MKTIVVIFMILLVNLVYGDYIWQCNDIKGPDTQATFKELGCYCKLCSLSIKIIIFS